MLNFGATNTHANGYNYGDDADWNGPTSYTWAAFLKGNDVPAGAGDSIMAKGVLGTNGWEIEWDVTGGAITATHWSGGAGSSATVSNNGIGTGTTRSWILTWTGANMNYFRDNVADGTPAFAQASGSGVDALEQGNRPALNRGAALSMGHTCFWKNYELTAGERALYHAGSEMPATANLNMWIRGNAEPAVEERNNVTGTEGGTVTLTADAVDGYFVAGGSFMMFLAEIFGPVVASASLGGAPWLDAALLKRRVLNRRCWMDLTASEVSEFLKTFKCRAWSLQCPSS